MHHYSHSTRPPTHTSHSGDPQETHQVTTSGPLFRRFDAVIWPLMDHYWTTGGPLSDHLVDHFWTKQNHNWVKIRDHAAHNRFFCDSFFLRFRFVLIWGWRGGSRQKNHIEALKMAVKSSKNRQKYLIKKHWWTTSGPLVVHENRKNKITVIRTRYLGPPTATLMKYVANTTYALRHSGPGKKLFSKTTFF